MANDRQGLKEPPPPSAPSVQELDRHSEAIPALRDALRYLDEDEPDTSVARLHYAIAQVGGALSGAPLRYKSHGMRSHRKQP